MKVVEIRAYGASDVLVAAERPTPVPADREVLVEIHAGAVNAVDRKIRSGMMQAFLSYSMPAVLGFDIAGVVRSLGAGATRFKAGDAVLGKLGIAVGGGYAEFVALDEALLQPIPAPLSFEEAAGLPLSGMTALEALTDHGDIRAGDKVLIHGGSGGVGHLAVQIAKTLGARVTTTVSAENAGFARCLGADEVIAYDSQDFRQVLGQSMDVVFDMIGGEVLEKSYDVLVPGGRLVTIWGQPDEALAASRGIIASTFVTSEGGDHLLRLARLASDGALRPRVTSTHPLSAEGLRAAHDRLEAGHGTGKVIVRVKGG